VIPDISLTLPGRKSNLGRAKKGARFRNETMTIRLLRTAFVGALSVTALAQVYAGSITGEVRFIDTAPKLAPINVTKDQDYCGQTLPNEGFLVASNGGLKNVVLFIEGTPIQGLSPQRENVIESTGCRFSPRVMAMVKGEKLIVKNSDPKLHIAHSYLDQRTVFTLSLPFRGTRLEITQKIRKPGILKVLCDTHAWMKAYIHVFDHPFFAVTDERGTFSIANIRAGQYTLKAWHEEAGIQSKEVVVPEEGEIRVSFGFAQKKTQP
jgi:hypothetical protein